MTTSDSNPPSGEEIKAAYQVIRRQQPWHLPSSSKLHSRILPNCTYSPWLTEPEFSDVYSKISRNSLVDIYRCYELWTLAKQIENVEGNVLEVGVWRGGTGALIATAVKDFASKKIFLADTFKGVVKAGANDPAYKGGEHADTSLAIVTSLIKSLELTNVEILEGIFPEDTQHRVEGSIAMLHSDVDVYASTKDIVDWCLPRLSVGAVLVFDDYGFQGCEGVTTFCNQFRARDDFTFIHNLNGHAIFIKLR